MGVQEGADVTVMEGSNVNVNVASGHGDRERRRGSLYYAHIDTYKINSNANTNMGSLEHTTGATGRGGITTPPLPQSSLSSSTSMSMSGPTSTFPPATQSNRSHSSTNPQQSNINTAIPIPRHRQSIPRRKSGSQKFTRSSTSTNHPSLSNNLDPNYQQQQQHSGITHHPIHHNHQL